MKPETISGPVLIFVGPTAIGKTELSLELAKLVGCEIVSVDSMQVYRYMDIGTAKASGAEREMVPHHLIDIVNPDQPYDAVRFAHDAAQAISLIHGRGKIPLLTGGTGLYLQSLLHGIFPGVPVSKEQRIILQKKLDKSSSSNLHKELRQCDLDSANKIHENDSQRIIRALEVFYLTGKPLSVHLNEHRATTEKSLYSNTLQIGLTTHREKLYKRINSRCHEMIDSGLEKEVKNLLGMGYKQNLNPMKSIGYRHMINYINKLWPKERMIELLSRDTRRYAKRQYTWFNKNKQLNWFDVEDQAEIIDKVSTWSDQVKQR